MNRYITYDHKEDSEEINVSKNFKASNTIYITIKVKIYQWKVWLSYAMLVQVILATIFKRNRVKIFNIYIKA
ncbi:hypothetical protein Q5M85_05600 [Paraclostridium bifermentans]|nr:hypothetical protein [Paraclostridium bifermentans]